MAKKRLQTVAIPLAWVGLDDAPITYVNQMILQMGEPNHPSEFLLTFGQLHPPVLLGDPDQNQAQLQAMPYVPVRVVAKLALSEQRVRELHGVIEKVLGNFDQAQRLAKGKSTAAGTQSRRRK
jgi:hypothetical protein